MQELPPLLACVRADGCGHQALQGSKWLRAAHSVTQAFLTRFEEAQRLRVSALDLLSPLGVKRLTTPQLAKLVHQMQGGAAKVKLPEVPLLKHVLAECRRWEESACSALDGRCTLGLGRDGHLASPGRRMRSTSRRGGGARSRGRGRSWREGGAQDHGVPTPPSVVACSGNVTLNELEDLLSQGEQLPVNMKLLAQLREKAERASALQRRFDQHIPGPLQRRINASQKLATLDKLRRLLAEANELKVQVGAWRRGCDVLDAAEDWIQRKDKAMQDKQPLRALVKLSQEAALIPVDLSDELAPVLVQIQRAREWICKVTACARRCLCIIATSPRSCPLPLPSPG